MVRAKFRVMEVSQLWNGKGTQVRLLPVMAKCSRFPEDTDVSEENARFWDATPSGDAKRFFSAGEDESWPCPHKIGECVYIDMEPGEGEWKLERRTQTEHQLDVSLTLGWHQRVDMSISNQAAWDDFQGKVGASWNVTFSPAPG